MTIELLFKIALCIVVLGVAIKIIKLLSGIVFKLALIFLVILFFLQLIK